MELDERLKEIRAVCDCLRYVQADVDKSNLPIVSLHIGLAVSEAQTVLDELTAKQSTHHDSGPRATGTGY